MLYYIYVCCGPPLYVALPTDLATQTLSGLTAVTAPTAGGRGTTHPGSVCPVLTVCSAFQLTRLRLSSMTQCDIFRPLRGASSVNAYHKTVNTSPRWRILSISDYPDLRGPPAARVYVHNGRTAACSAVAAKSSR